VRSVRSRMAFLSFEICERTAHGEDSLEARRLVSYKKNKQLPWGVERRYEFIEFRLYWQGRINRGDLIDTFGVSTQQASLDINTYLQQAKRAFSYDTRKRTYIRGKHFKPRYWTPDAQEYFAQLRAVDQGLVSEDQSWISVFPGLGPRQHLHVGSRLKRSAMSWRRSVNRPLCK